MDLKQIKYKWMKLGARLDENQSKLSKRNKNENLRG